MTALVVAVSRSARHSFSKVNQGSIRLQEGLGVEGDAHAGKTIQHLSRIARTPDAPNLRQVHLMHSELHDELRGKGFQLEPGQMGENVTTQGIDLLSLPVGTRLKFGLSACVEVAGLRNPCKQLNTFEDGLMNATLEKNADGTLARKAGVMAIVVVSGDVRVGDEIAIELPAKPHRELEPV